VTNSLLLVSNQWSATFPANANAGFYRLWINN